MKQKKEHLPGRAESVWMRPHRGDAFSKLSRDLTVDVAVVGAGVTGLTAGFLLAHAGTKVAVLEKGRVGQGETGYTTAHLTEALDTRYATFEARFGRELTRLLAESSRAAIQMCERLVRTQSIPCQFTRLPGYLYSEDGDEAKALKEEADCLARLRCEARWTNDIPLPFPAAGGIRLEQQAQLNPYPYSQGLARGLVNAGGQIFESTPVLNIVEGEPCTVETSEGVVTARAVIVASHVPINDQVFRHTNLAAYRSYVLAAAVDDGPAGLFWDTERPYHYIRTHEDDKHKYLIVGGNDHKTGSDVDPRRAFFALREYMKARFAVGHIRYRWSGQIVESVDGLPVIGRNALQSHVYVATGYSGNGMTFGTLAGMILSDLILHRPNAFASVCEASRFQALSTAGTHLRPSGSGSG